jgi:hypothetical protein
VSDEVYLLYTREHHRRCDKYKVNLNLLICCKKQSMDFSICAWEKEEFVLQLEKVKQRKWSPTLKIFNMDDSDYYWNSTQDWFW